MKRFSLIFAGVNQSSSTPVHSFSRHSWVLSSGLRRGCPREHTHFPDGGSIWVPVKAQELLCGGAAPGKNLQRAQPELLASSGERLAQLPPEIPRKSAPQQDGTSGLRDLDPFLHTRCKHTVSFITSYQPG